MFGKSSSPTSDQTRRRIQTRRDLGIGKARGGVQHDPSALHILEGQLLRPRDPLKLTTFIVAELNPITRRSRHRPHIRRPHPDSFKHSNRYF
jgi:hypothetical protein